MRPLDLDILLHYYTRGNDYRDGDFEAPAVAEAVGDILPKLGLLQQSPVYGRALYEITERGKAYIEALLKMPLPVQLWVIPAGNQPGKE